MKKLTTLLITLTSTLLLAILFYLLVHKKSTPLITPLVKTECLTKRNLTQYVSANGDLEIKDTIKLGSILSGIIKDIYVKENDSVIEGQLLAVIDPGTGETDFEQAYNDFLKTDKEYQYRKKNVARKKALYLAKQLSQDEFELLEKDLSVLAYSLKSAQARLDREKLLLGERNIYAPQAGIITKCTITKGSGVVGSTVAASDPLIEITPDFSMMDIRLHVDESDISYVQKNQKIKLTFNALADQPIYTTVSHVGFSPKKMEGSLFYKVSAELKNSSKKLRPGMIVNAKIYVAEKEEVPSLHGFAFQINHNSIEMMAKSLNITYQPLSKAQRTKIKTDNPTKRIKFVWVLENNSFIQKAVSIGIISENYFEIIDGITATEQVINEIAMPDAMNNVYKKWFSGPFS